jgi:ankyrin repeat protein
MFITADRFEECVKISDIADSDIKELTEESVKLIRQFYTSAHSYLEFDKSNDQIATLVSSSLELLDLQLATEYFKRNIPGFNAKSKTDYRDILVAFTSIFGLTHTLNTLIFHSEIGLEITTMLIFSIQRDIAKYFNENDLFLKNIYQSIIIPRQESAKDLLKEYLPKTLSTWNSPVALSNGKTAYEYFADLLEKQTGDDSEVALKIIVPILKEEQFKKYRIQLENHLLNRITEVHADNEHVITTTDHVAVPKFKVFFKYVIGAGINPNAVVNLDGRVISYLCMAACMGFVDLCEFLLNVGAELETANKVDDADQAELHLINEGTALFYAIAIDKASLVKLFLSNKANVNYVTPDKETAITLAIDRKCMKALKELLTHPDSRYKINLDKHGKEQKSALAYAKSKNNLEAINLIKEAMQRQHKNKIFQGLWKLYDKKFDTKKLNCADFLDLLIELRCEIIENKLQFTSAALRSLAFKAKPIPGLPSAIIVDKEFIATIVESPASVNVYSIDKYLKNKYVVNTPTVVVEKIISSPSEESKSTVVPTVSVKSTSVIKQSAPKLPSPKVAKPKSARKSRAHHNSAIAKPELTLNELILKKLTDFAGRLPNFNIVMLAEKLDDELDKFTVEDLAKLDSNAISKIVDLSYSFGLSKFLQKLAEAKSNTLSDLLIYDLYMHKLKRKHLIRIEGFFESLAVSYQACLPACQKIQENIFAKVICPYIIKNDIDPTNVFEVLFAYRYHETPELFKAALIAIKKLLPARYLAELKMIMCRIAFKTHNPCYLDFFTAVLQNPDIIDINEIHDDGYGLKITFLLACVMNDNEEAYFRLINYNPNLELRCELMPEDRKCRLENGSTAVMIAARRGNLTILKDLINRKANVNAVSYANETALRIVIAYQWVDSIPLLIGNGADIDTARGDFYHMTAWELATSSGFRFSEARDLLHQELQKRNDAWKSDRGWGHTITLFHGSSSYSSKSTEYPAVDEIDDSAASLMIGDLLDGLPPLQTSPVSTLMKDLAIDMSNAPNLFGVGPPDNSIFHDISTPKIRF